MSAVESVKRDYTRSQLTPEQQEQRRRGISASDVPVILGLSRYKTPYQLWEEKTGKTDPQWDEKGSHYAEWGNRLEPVIAEAYHSLAHDGVGMSPGDTLVHPEHSWAMATPDYRVYDSPANVTWLLECKNRSAFSKGWGPSGSQEIPADVLAQVRWQMFVAQAGRVDVAVLVGGNDFRVYTILRDAHAEASLFAQMVPFYHEHLVKQRPPPQTAAERAGWVTVAGKVERPPLNLATNADLSARWLALAQCYTAYKASVDVFGEKLERARNEIIAEAQQHKSVTDTWGSVTVGVRDGRSGTNWELVAGELAATLAQPDVVRQIQDKHKKQGSPYATVTVKLTETP